MNEIELAYIWSGIDQAIEKHEKITSADLVDLVQTAFWLEGHDDEPEIDTIEHFEALIAEQDPDPATQLGVWLAAVRRHLG